MVICKDVENVRIALGNKSTAFALSWGEADFKKISVLAVNQVKGLEFDEVVVVNDGMNENEKYVAYTRALVRLYIVM